MVTGFLAALLFSQQGKPFPTRFQQVSPLPLLPPITIDSGLNYQGPAKEVAAKNNLQARMIWIDATANVERYNTEDKIVDLVKKIRSVGFNTLVLDVKPISGEVIFPSQFAPKLGEWRGKVLPANFDPVEIFSRECSKEGLSMFASMNAFSDGHRLLQRGPGFDRVSEQSVVYEPSPILRIGTETYPVEPKPFAEVRLPEPKTNGITIRPDTTKSPKLQIFSSVKSLPSGPITPDPTTQNSGSTSISPSQSNLTGFILEVRGNGEVIEGYEDIMSRRPSIVLPKGAQLIYGQGPGASFLRENAIPGKRVVIDSEANFLSIGESMDQQYPLMTNPNDPVVRKRLVDIATEFVSKYKVDGIIYDDRLRYTGINGDFSQITRDQFEKHVGAQLHWPDDVFKFTYTWGQNRGIKPGPYYEAWLSWRANVLKGFVGEIRGAIRKVRAGTQLAVYAGSWYGEYPAFGNNWASDDFEAGFWFLDKQYSQTGMAGNLDFLVTGCYYPSATVNDAMQNGRNIGSTVESAGYLSYRAVHDQTWVYAGISLQDFKDNPEDLGEALQAAVFSTNGVMVFDLSHDIEPMWPVFEKAFRISKSPPHKDPFYLASVRNKAKVQLRLGKKEPPVIIATGSAGVGF